MIGMKNKMMRFLFCLVLGAVLPASSARANVYATDIKVNGSLSTITNPAASSVTISYILNQTATRGVTVAITQGTNQVVTLTGETSMGVNTVEWGLTNSSGAAVAAGAYSLSITASADDLSGGASNWTQISIDGPNTAANYPLGMDVDKNTNSPYYGRVVVGCAVPGIIYGVAQSDGLYKANADGSPADEGAFGYAGYATNDNGDIGTNQMPDFGSSYHDYSLPGLIRIGGDDRIYFIDQSGNGAVVACDILATTNQLVICEGPGNSSTGLGASIGYHHSPHNYANNPDGGLLNVSGEGWGQFDVAGFETGHPALYLVDTGDSPSAGVWMYRLTNGASDPADTVGTQVVGAATNQSLFVVTGAGVSVDANLDVFVGQDRANATDVLNRVFAFTNWNGGVLPPEGGGANTYALPLVDAPTWMVGMYQCRSDLHQRYGHQLPI